MTGSERSLECDGHPPKTALPTYVDRFDSMSRCRSRGKSSNPSRVDDALTGTWAPGNHKPKQCRRAGGGPPVHSSHPEREAFQLWMSSGEKVGQERSAAQKE